MLAHHPGRCGKSEETGNPAGGQAEGRRLTAAGARKWAHGSGRAGDSRGEPEGVVESERVESGEIVETNVRQLFYFF